MNITFPTIGEYNQHFLKKGNNGFQTLQDIVLLPSRTLPIKLFLFGSGAYAAVFKGSIKGKTYAIRCFLADAQDTIPRYNLIAKSLNNINPPWKVDFEFLDKELFIKDTAYPILKMEWVEGQLINDFIDKNLHNNDVLSEIQSKLVHISIDLEKHGIAHGDLQFGNIMVTGNSNSFELRLIDYDGMYVPEMASWEAIELGRSEFQHPSRNKHHFNSRIDRFSFWVILTGLEAIKHDKSLWNQVMQGGFNTLDNCLFTIQDFANPNQSKLFQKLSRIGNTALDFYAGKLISFCLNDINSISAPILKDERPVSTISSENSQTESEPSSASDFLISSQDFKIDCVNGIATILSSSFKRIGQTPILLNKNEFEGKTIIIANGFETKQLVLFATQLEYNIHLDNGEGKKKKTFSNGIDDYEIDDNRIEEIRREIEEMDAKWLDEDSIEKENKAKLAEEKEELEKLTAKRSKQELREKQEDERRVKREGIRKKGVITIVILIALALAYGYFTKDKSNFVSQKEQHRPVENIKVNNHVNLLTERKGAAPIKKLVNFEGVIMDILNAEEVRDFDKIYALYNPKMKRYWDMDNPSYLSLKKRYEYIWEFTSNSKNKVKKIERINANDYDVYTEFSYYNMNKAENFVANSIIRYVFEENGSVIEIYGLEHDIQKAITTTSTANNPHPRSKPDRDTYFIYKTKFSNPPFEIALRNKPSASGLEVYVCPKDAVVYVIERTGPNYYKAYVNGYIGFLSKHHLVAK